MKDIEVSPRMKFEEALDWIIKYDMENSKSCLEAGKIKN
jgi:hypothetical protein